MSWQSPVRQQPQPQQPRQRLLNEALSHGPYLWSNRDVENALLWFRSSSPSANNNESTSATSEGRRFLRCMLRARGIWMLRPLADRLQRRSSNKKRKLSSSSAGNGDAGNIIGQRQREKGGRKRSRRIVDGGGEETSESKRITQSSSPLQSLIMGYYQLILPATLSNGHSKSVEGNGIYGDDVHYFTMSDIQNAETASSKLLEDMGSIITVRRRTSEIYQAFSNVVHREEGNGKRSGREIPRVTPDGRMNQTIDEYMTHPTTCTRRAYASCLFQRLIDLCQEVPGPTAVTNNFVNGVRNDDVLDNNPALRKFLQKLMGLANENVRVQEVVLMLLLEPMRRLQLQWWKEGQPGQSQLMSSQLEMGGESSGAELSPLLTSTSFWATVSPKTLEQACSRPPLPALVQFILKTCPKAESSTASTAAAVKGKHYSTQTIVWWNLPSPLLCTISQWHFPIACKYICYWIDRAIMGHDEFYEGTTAQRRQSSDKILLDNSNNEKLSFQHSILRIRQFCSTSERLHLLGCRFLQSAERGSQKVLKTSLLVSEEDENASFKKSLAWKAIYHALFS